MIKIGQPIRMERRFTADDEIVLLSASALGYEFTDGSLRMGAYGWELTDGSLRIVTRVVYRANLSLAHPSIYLPAK